MYYLLNVRTTTYMNNVVNNHKVKWSPGSNTVNGHVEKLPGPDDGEEPIDALKNGHHHLVLVLRRVNRLSKLKIW